MSTRRSSPRLRQPSAAARRSTAGKRQKSTKQEKLLRYFGRESGSRDVQGKRRPSLAGREESDEDMIAGFSDSADPGPPSTMPTNILSPAGPELSEASSSERPSSEDLESPRGVQLDTQHIDLAGMLGSSSFNMRSPDAMTTTMSASAVAGAGVSGGDAAGRRDSAASTTASTELVFGGWLNGWHRPGAGKPSYADEMELLPPSPELTRSQLNLLRTRIKPHEVAAWRSQLKKLNDTLIADLAAI